MLREITSKHIKPRIVPFQLTTASNVATVNIGYGDITATASAAGTGIITPRFPFSRNGFLLLGQSTGAGFYATQNSATGSGASFPFSILDTAGSGADGSCEGFLFGFDSTDLSFAKKQRVSATQGAPRVIWGKITGSTGAVAIGTSDFSVVVGTTGVYNITFKKAFGKTPIVRVQPISTSAGREGVISAKTTAGVTISMTNGSGTANTADFYIIAVGSDSTTDSARGRMPLQNSQRKPRIVAGQILNTAGTPSISIGGATGGADLITLVDNGAGDFSFTIADSFIREPAIFLTTTTQRVLVHSYTAGIVRLLTRNASSTNTDVTGVTHIFMIGSDDASEY